MPPPRPAQDAAATRAGARALPKAPVLGWYSLWPVGQSRLPNVGDLPNQAMTTSGRAALLAVLRQLDLPAGTGVMVPTYHCPTMVAPVLQAGLVPVYFPIDEHGLPWLDALAEASTRHVRVMFVAHYFGLPKDLQAVLAWCQARGIVLVEDCAHSFFGQAGARPVGAWGDYATASLSKFFPVAEAGLLASARHALKPLGLRPAGWRGQIKGAVDVLEFSHANGRLAGPSQLLAPLFWLKGLGAPAAEPVALPGPGVTLIDEDAMMASCDMARAGQAPTLASRWLYQVLPRRGIIARRRQHFQTYLQGLAELSGARALAPRLPDASAPYVFPLWIDDAHRADAIYTRMRLARLPVFRWDRIWPGTPTDPQDAGWRWSRQVLQLLCHQDLRASEVAQVIATTRQFFETHRDPGPTATP